MFFFISTWKSNTTLSLLVQNEITPMCNTCHYLMTINLLPYNKWTACFNKIWTGLITSLAGPIKNNSFGPGPKLLFLLALHSCNFIGYWSGSKFRAWFDCFDNGIILVPCNLDLFRYLWPISFSSHVEINIDTVL